jgi:hypothetical protein
MAKERGLYCERRYYQLRTRSIPATGKPRASNI